MLTWFKIMHKSMFTKPLFTHTHIKSSMCTLGMAVNYLSENGSIVVDFFNPKPRRSYSLLELVMEHVCIALVFYRYSPRVKEQYFWIKCDRTVKENKSLSLQFCIHCMQKLSSSIKDTLIIRYTLADKDQIWLCFHLNFSLYVKKISSK